MYEGNREGVRQSLDERPKAKSDDAFGELDDIFPALKKYRSEHNSDNLRKLMVEILEFCRAVYASTQSEADRKIYREFVKKLDI